MPFIGDLDPTKPAATDPVGAGDDEFRNLKQTLQDTFPEASAAVPTNELAYKDAANIWAESNAFRGPTDSPTNIGIRFGPPDASGNQAAVYQSTSNGAVWLISESTDYANSHGIASWVDNPKWWGGGAVVDIVNESGGTWGGDHTWSGTHTFSALVSLTGTIPELRWIETDTVDVNTKIINNGGVLSFQTVSDAGVTGNTNMQINNNTGQVSLRYGGVDRLATTNNGIDVTGQTNTKQTGSSLLSVFERTDAGDAGVRYKVTGGVQWENLIQNATGDFGIFDRDNGNWSVRCEQLGSVRVYHSGVTKLETSSTGVLINGLGGALHHGNSANNSGTITITTTPPGAGAGNPGDVWYVV